MNGAIPITSPRQDLMRNLPILLCVTALTLTACSDDSVDTLDRDAVSDTSADVGETETNDDTFDPTTLPVNPPETLGDDRVAKVHAPADYDRTKSYPLVIMLHGYSANGYVQDLFIFKLSAQVTDDQFILVIPDGTKDSGGKQFWNATPQCCNFDGSDVDDVAYLTSLIEEAEQKMHIDTDRVGLVGHSNGGYMSYRMACEKPDLIDRIAVLSGSTYIDPDDCLNPQATSVLHIHGTADTVIPYQATGEDGPGRTTIGAEATVDRWRERAGCSETADAETTADFDTFLAGEETDVIEWNTCTSGELVALWRLNGGDHTRLTFNNMFNERLANWLTLP